MKVATQDADRVAAAEALDKAAHLVETVARQACADEDVYTVWRLVSKASMLRRLASQLYAGGL